MTVLRDVGMELLEELFRHCKRGTEEGGEEVYKRIGSG